MILWLLLFGHYLADFPLQGDFIAKYKAPKSADYWFHVMTAHCVIQGGIVSLITHNLWLGLAEFVIHFCVDCLKCKGKLTFNQDQAIHLLCKLLWWGLV
jgi:hypothetical protein